MRKSRLTKAQIMGVLRQAEGGMPVAELCREHGIKPPIWVAGGAGKQDGADRPGVRHWA